MASSLASNFKFLNEMFYSGVIEAISQNVNIFNESSNGSIIMGSDRKLGDYFYESFFDQNSAVSRRDNTSVSAADAVALTMDNMIDVKCLGKFLQDAALDAIKKALNRGSSVKELNFIMGKQYAMQKMKYMVNFALAGVQAGITGQSTNVYDNTSSSTTSLTHSALVKGMSKMGDKAQDIKAWVMHSKAYYDLVGNAITDKITNVADRAIYGATPGTLGRPVIIVDDDSLVDDSASTTYYYTLGLVQGGVRVIESEEENVVSKIVTGNEQLLHRLQAEFAFNLGLKGLKWNVSAGKANPTAATVGTTTNWELAVTSHKHIAGVAIKTT
jgi:hypothetical protein